MLSPASLRVCCLAVMAPALTKADRQADCLPVVLSESFCVSKTPHSLNGEDKVNEIRFKCAYSSEYVQNKRKPFMHRACWRTQKSGPGFLNKYRSLSFDSPKSLLCSGRVRTQRDAKNKPWLSTNATTAYAGKIKLKYTMNKNISNIKNMGLAKANTSLGLQSLKKVKQFSKENQSSGPNVMDDSLNFSDSQDSTGQLGPLISDIGVLATNSDSEVLPMDIDTEPCVNNNGRTSPEDDLNAISDVGSEQPVSESVLENVSQSLLTSSSANLVEPMDTSVTLTDLLCSVAKSTESVRNSPANSVSSLTCDFPVSNLQDVDCEPSGIPDSTMTLQSSVNDSPFEDLPPSESDVPSETSIDIPVQPLVSKEVSGVMFSKFRDLKLPVLNNNCSGTPFMASSMFSILTCSKLVMNASKLSSKEPLCPVLTDCRFGLQYSAPIRKEKSVCCLPTSQELESLELILADKSVSINSVLFRSTLLLRKQMNAHARKQISSLVEHYQRKYQIPCQRPAKHVNIKSGKDLVDLKAELLQSEDVKSMSTAALVSLVRKLETSGSQTKILSPKILSSPEAIESMTLNLEPDECDDIKHTSDLMLSNLKNLVKLSDPYFTDSSEDECVSETEDEETESDTTDNKNALWKYLTERAALASSSTWLLARNHELEYRIKEYDDQWSEIIKAEGKVCLEELAVSQNLESSTGSDNASSQLSVKPHSVKSFLLPLNGFLDPSDASHIAKTAVSESFLPELESSKRTDSNIEVEGSCSRTKPLNTGAFRKRKLAFIPGLHATNPKFSRLSSVNCYCNSQSEFASCILCTGQYNSTQSIDPHSMALRDRIAILDPYFHPVLSSEKDIPVCLQLENYFKIDAKYRNIQPVSLDLNSVESEEIPAVKPKFSDLRSHRKLSRYARSLSAKYRKHHRNSRHLRKHKLVFGKWRRLHSKRTLHARARFRRHSVVSSGSSPDSPVLSPMSVLDDGFEKRRRDENQFDIDDVIIPCNSRSGRLVEIQYKEIMIPSWRSVEDEILLLESCETEDSENITDSFLTKKHDMLEVEEKEKMKRAALGLNRRRRNRCDSRADSSGANTPDPTTLYNNQENVFQVPNFTTVIDPPASPVSPPATPNSAVVSDDSQSAFGNGSLVRPEKRKILIPKRPVEENTSTRTLVEFEEVLPFEPLEFPLSDEIYEELLAEADHDKEEYDIPSYNLNYTPSPISSSSSTSTVDEEEDDVTDPEWTVVKTMRNGPDQALVLKFAKR